MSAAETIALIRDLVIIISALVITIVAVLVGILLFRIYRPVRSAARNLDNASNLVLHGLVRPLNSLAALVELVNRGLAMVEDFKSRNRGQEDGEEQ